MVINGYSVMLDLTFKASDLDLNAKNMVFKARTKDLTYKTLKVKIKYCFIK